MGVGRCGEEGRGEVLGWEVGYGGGGGGGGDVKEDIDPRGVEETWCKNKKIKFTQINHKLHNIHPRNPTQQESPPPRGVDSRALGYRNPPLGL